jgi:hypothetical protein
VLQYGDPRESRPGALVAAAPGGSEAVGAPAGSLAEQWHPGVVVAEEPGDAHPHPCQPSVVTGDDGRAQAGVGQRGYLAGTLIGGGSALLIRASSLRGYHGWEPRISAAPSAANAMACADGDEARAPRQKRVKDSSRIPVVRPRAAAVPSAQREQPQPSSVPGPPRHATPLAVVT